MLECKNLTCVREERVLFNNLNFALSPGEILHVEGPNGIGKTSLFRLLVGLSSPYSGDIYWQQQNIMSDRESYYQNMLYLGHKSGVKPELTALENLQFFHRLYNPSVELDLWDILTLVGLVGYENIPTAQLSAGQQRRVALARMWFSDCPLWILDEPFTAIDKSGVKVIENLLIKHAHKGGMIILTTHQDLSLPTDLYKKLTLQKPAIGEQYV
ncbi:cytochrome c biogenesis heme-transporting ATPase CcmA [Psychromonas sp. SP041]|uniref:cytochrome c biogenesis heme-transporting ATPase CcmA n=1 Tax=Psychromonas sp. SP041 TaxID=1365007 RepID=UPI0003F6D746|nr:cytochrome c biogenesis heme-transporting ATPase CcmA [Psychromonas sp. SP041]